jgi:hypothetical protein
MHMPLEPLWTGSELLHKLLNDFLSGKLKTPQFCADIEKAYNDAIDERALNPTERKVFEALFDEVVWFDPRRKETWEYSGYRTEEQIKAAALEAAAKLKAPSTRPI